MAKQNVRTLNEWVLIEKLTEETKTKSGIIIPEATGRRKPKKGKVIQTDGDAKVKVGETVIYPQGVSVDIVLEDKPYELVDAKDLWLVV